MQAIRQLLLAVLLALGGVGEVSASDKWLVRQKNPSPEGQWVLRDDGSVTRGDPKTNYDQEENQAHSNRVDISGWILNGQGDGGHTDYKLEYLAPGSTSESIERVIMTYDLTKGQATGAVRERIATVQEPPDLSGMVLDGKVHVRADGTSQAVYFNQDKTANAVVDYDAAGNFVRATTWSKETLLPNKVTAPTYCTQTYGCIQ